jgi:hypothetical protein
MPPPPQSSGRYQSPPVVYLYKERFHYRSAGGAGQINKASTADFPVTSGIFRRNMLGLIAGFFRYYTVSQPLWVRSAFGAEETKHRLMSLNEHGNVYVKINRKGEIIMCATRHAVGRGTPVIPQIRAILQDEGGAAVLHGEMGLNSGIRAFAAIFLAILLVCEILPGGKEAFPGAVLCVIAFYFLFLIAAYGLGRSDSVVIAQRLGEALGVPVRMA